MFGMFTQVAACKTCHGSGEIPKEICDYCDYGLIQKTRNLKINIPPGVDNGSQIRLS